MSPPLALLAISSYPPVPLAPPTSTSSSGRLVPPLIESGSLQDPVAIRANLDSLASLFAQEPLSAAGSTPEREDPFGLSTDPLDALGLTQEDPPERNELVDEVAQLNAEVQQDQQVAKSLPAKQQQLAQLKSQLTTVEANYQANKQAAFNKQLSKKQKSFQQVAASRIKQIDSQIAKLQSQIGRLSSEKAQLGNATSNATQASGANSTSTDDSYSF